MSKKKDKCIFNDSWLVDERFKEWIDKMIINGKLVANFAAKILISQIWALQP